MGNKPGQITREAIEEAEAAEDLDDILAGSPSDWEFDVSTEGEEEAEAKRAEEHGDEDEDDNPPTPILDAYERSRDPAEMERLIQESFDSLPERAGPQRYNHKRREQQRWKTIRVREFTSNSSSSSSMLFMLSVSGGLSCLRLQPFRFISCETPQSNVRLHQSCMLQLFVTVSSKIPPLSVSNPPKFQDFGCTYGVSKV